MAAFLSKDLSAPLGEINTTPLIDVMLVMLVMFIITVPAAMHSVEVELPSTGLPPPIVPEPDRNRVVLTSGDRLLWNGAAIGEAQLAGLLARTRAMKPEPVLEFQPEANAAYDLSAKTLAVIKQSRVTGFGFVGNEAYGEFGKESKPD